ncbi:hypothetical protein HY045_00730 [Candidatus Woesebacteria bacterium]|nr:hypothetical protein [Candidatus Woesebacteria bacterium]
MNAVRLFVHLFLPHESNNHKARILHPSGLLTIIFLLVAFQGLISFIPKIHPSILGYASQISVDEVVRLTNEKRQASGLIPLSVNSTLSQAALAKGNDMLEKGYWAHVAPDGTQPWYFFTHFGYGYKYAGENLARDFSSAPSAVDAWMNSPSHRDNLLSGRYKETGIAVVEGNLNGSDTTIIVQFFGTKFSDTVPVVPVAKAEITSTPKPQIALSKTPVPTLVATPAPEATAVPILGTTPTPGPTPGLNQNNSSSVSGILISPFTTTKGLSLAVVGILLIVLLVDGIITSRRRIARIGGRTFAHMAFLGMIVAIALILKAGKIL